MHKTSFELHMEEALGYGLSSRTWNGVEYRGFFQRDYNWELFRLRNSRLMEVGIHPRLERLGDNYLFMFASESDVQASKENFRFVKWVEETYKPLYQVTTHGSRYILVPTGKFPSGFAKSDLFETSAKICTILNRYAKHDTYIVTSDVRYGTNSLTKVFANNSLIITPTTLYTEQEA